MLTPNISSFVYGIKYIANANALQLLFELSK